MVSGHRNFSRQSIFGYSKDFAKSGIVLILFLVACSHKTEIVEVKPTIPSKIPDAEQLTNQGDNVQPFLLADDKLLFVSSHRERHSQDQIYLMDLKTRKERRLSFQAGDCSEVVGTGDRIFYSSTTDKIKEHPRIISKKNAPAGSDLYESDLSGYNIQRLTTNKEEGFVTDLALEKSRVLFVKTDKDHHTLSNFNFEKKKESVLLDKKTTAIFAPLYIEKSKIYVWIEGDDHLIKYVKGAFRNPEMMTLTTGVAQALSLSPDDKLIVTSFDQSLGQSQVYSYDFSTKSLELIYNHPGHIQKALLNGFNELIFASDAGGSFQIYRHKIAPAVSAAPVAPSGPVMTPMPAPTGVTAATGSQKLVAPNDEKK